MSDTDHDPLKPWPTDVVPIVAADRDKAVVSQMEAVVHVECRDCSRKLSADSRTIRSAALMHVRAGRPIVFLCLDCFQTYEFEHVQECRDMRNGRSDVYRRGEDGQLQKVRPVVVS